MSQLKVFSWNVNGIRAVIRKDAFVPFVKKFEPDILCLQETKAVQGDAEIDLPDYQEFWHSADKKGYSGTAIFSKTEPEDVINGMPEDIIAKHKLTDKYGDTTKEGRVIAAEFKDHYVATVYTPNAKDDLTRIPVREQWDTAYLEYMQRLEKKKPVIFCGDLNVAHTEIDLARPKQNEGKKGYTKEERDGLQAYIDKGFVDTFRFLHPKQTDAYTWWSHWGNARDRNVGWRIDYFMVSGKLKDKLVSADIHADIMGSDHCPISVMFEV